jgi:hypothetical protein
MKTESEGPRGAPPVAPAPLQSQLGFGDEQDHEEVDPLADFLQDFEADAAQSTMSVPAPTTENSAPAANDDDDDDDLDSFLDGLDSYDQVAEAPAPPAQQGSFTAPVQEPPHRATSAAGNLDNLDAGSDPFANFMTTEDEFDLDIAPQPVQAVAPPEPEYVPKPLPVRPAPPKPQAEKRPEPAPQQQPTQKQQAPQQQLKQARPANDQKGQRDAKLGQPHHELRGNATRDRGEPQRQEPLAEESRKGGQQGGSRPQERSHDRQIDRAPSRPDAQSSGPKTGKMRPGRLFGWLVSFESPDGRAIELREGKFFVTGSSIRVTDLVIEDASISTPHALMSVSADHGLLIQDLMSERGVFIRVGERGQYKREDGVVELKHGDWVRFGDVEFLVTVVPTGR